MLVVLGLAVVAVLAQGLGRRRGARADASGLGERLPEVTSSGADSAASSPHRSEFDAIEAELQQMLADAPDEPVTRGRPD